MEMSALVSHQTVPLSVPALKQAGGTMLFPPPLPARSNFRQLLHVKLENGLNVKQQTEQYSEKRGHIEALKQQNSSERKGEGGGLATEAEPIKKQQR